VEGVCRGTGDGRRVRAAVSGQEGKADDVFRFMIYEVRDTIETGRKIVSQTGAVALLRSVGASKGAALLRTFFSFEGHGARGAEAQVVENEGVVGSKVF